SFQERLPWSKGYNILPVQSDEIVCLKMITPQEFSLIPNNSQIYRIAIFNKKAASINLRQLLFCGE
ncbi:hypothetical protein ACR784_16840, partial [Sphingobacterium multivorum]|uniref:hypothetical protein n=1 Tax=Sphingobacterium multivorum TaxID=28454 RepID=UPI003DA2E8AE